VTREELPVNSIMPEAIDASFVPQPAAGVHTVELDGEAVLYDERRSRLHVLNPIATLVWSCFDGVSSLDAVIADLAAVFEVDATVVGADVLRLACSLGGEGLLAGVFATALEEPAADGDGHADPAGPITQDRDVEEPRFLEEPPSA
jgi:hypothetical protein